MNQSKLFLIKYYSQVLQSMYSFRLNIVSFYFTLAENHRRVLAENHRRVLAENHLTVLAENHPRVLAELLADFKPKLVLAYFSFEKMYIYF